MAVYDPWLASVLEKPAWRVTEKIPENLILGNMDPIFIDAKSAVHELNAHTNLIRCGFRLVCTSVSLKCNRFMSVPAETGGPGCGVRFAEASDRSSIAEMASNSFKYDRFHMDTSIPSIVADRIKRNWAENFFCGRRGDWMVVAHERRQIVGFLQLLNKDDESLVIDLIAVRESARGRGYASRMISFAADNSMNSPPIYVGTQLTNLPSIALYENLGFRMSAADHVFHFNRG